MLRVLNSERTLGISKKILEKPDRAVEIMKLLGLLDLTISWALRVGPAGQIKRALLVPRERLRPTSFLGCLVRKRFSRDLKQKADRYRSQIDVHIFSEDKVARFFMGINFVFALLILASLMCHISISFFFSTKLFLSVNE